MNTGSQSFFTRLKKNKKKLAAFYFLAFLVLIALFANVIANKKPLCAVVNGETYFPAFNDHNMIDWKTFKCDNKVFAPIPYSAAESDFENPYIGPFDEQFLSSSQKTKLAARYRHHAGTDKRGQDVLAGIIYGTRISLATGILSMLLATVIGLLLGMMSAWFGNDKISVTRIKLIVTLLFLLPAWFYAFTLRRFLLHDALQQSVFSFGIQLVISLVLFAAIIYFPVKSCSVFNSIKALQKKVYIPIDTIITKCIEVFVSLPRLILILTFAAIAKPSITNLILIFGLTAWTEIARLVRAETLKIKEQTYIEAARALGYNTRRILFRHILPNLKPVLLTTFVFGAAQIILAESALSFLSIGVPDDTVSWGKLIASGKENINAWWLIVFPSLMLFLTVASLNALRET